MKRFVRVRRLPLVLGAACLTSMSLAGPARAQVEVETVVEDADFVTGIAFLSDGTMLFNERDGVIRTMHANGEPGDSLAEIPTVIEGETGLLGIAVAPDEGSVYVFATELDGQSNTVWRVPLGGGEPERVVTEMAASFYHNGGGVSFDGDGMLLVSNGERHESAIAQDPNAIGGKVYRFTPDGEVPPDNPFGVSPSFAIGLRNPYAMTIDPETQTPWVTDNGPSSYDEVDRIEAGGNYGWPYIWGPVDENPEVTRSPEDLEAGDYVEPAASYRDIIVPTGIAFAGEGASDEYAGDLFFGAYGEESIHRLTLNDARDAVVEDEIFHRPGEPVVAMAWGPEGLYFSTPDSIQLLAIGGVEEPTSEETPSAGGGDAQPSPSPSASPTSERSGIGTLIAIAIPLLLLLGFMATRNRMDRAARDIEGPGPPDEE